MKNALTVNQALTLLTIYKDQYTQLDLSDMVSEIIFLIGAELIKPSGAIWKCTNKGTEMVGRMLYATR